MKKRYNLMLVILLTSACTILSQGKNTNADIKPSPSSIINSTSSPSFTPYPVITNNSPIPSIINTPISSPKETISPSSITITVSPVVEKTITKVEIYNKRNGYLFSSSDNSNYKDSKELIEFNLIDNYYYDLDVKVTYSDNSVSYDFILKSSDNSIANIDNTGRVFTHSTNQSGTFSFFILEKNTNKEICKVKSGAISGSQNYKIKTVGTIYDAQNNIVKGANISIINVDQPDESKYIFVDQPIDGTYTLRFAPVASRMEIIVSKEGYKTQKRYFIIKGDPEVETFNFGGSNPDDKQYALEKI